jgi:hypothetical protein
MSSQGARAGLVFACFLACACGARVLDFEGPDGGSGDSGIGTGGAGGSGGSGTAGTSGSGAGGSGTGGTNTGPYIKKGPAGVKISKVDLLFMIDNSSSMADKQTILSTAIPDLVDRLVEPKCIDPLTGIPLGSAINGLCSLGELSFAPVSDIHIGVISSSLGGHGADGVCSDANDMRTDPHNDDRGHLVTRGVGGTIVPTFNNKGFLFYNPSVSGAFNHGAAVAAPFQDLVAGMGQHGCGYEASLESVYRFLVDPDPYDKIAIDRSVGGFGMAVLQGTDNALLQQRADFLRPDSLVSVVLLTDENDCSVVDGGQGFYPLIPFVTGTGRSVLKPGTSVCVTNPNDKCCFNCGQQSAPAECPPPETDPACQDGELRTVQDQPNLRCFNQKQRYGVDFLYPVQRYVDGFTSPIVPNRKGESVKNPLFSDLTCATGAGCASLRDPSLVFVTGIVGVPWQDIAVNPGDLGAGLKTGKQLREENVWATIVGDPLNPSGPVAPRDAHMIESIKPRAGLAGPESGPGADPIHGHEWDPSNEVGRPNGDLQYACTFDLSAPATCTPDDCDCFTNVAEVKKPICQDEQGAYTFVQRQSKAYPGTRILQVLQGLGEQAIVGSICPAQTTDRTRPDFGYAPVVNGLMQRLRYPLGGQCQPDALPVDPATRQTPCAIIEVFNDSRCLCDNEPGRVTARDALLTPEMKAIGSCRCEIKQLSGDPQTRCLNDTYIPSTSGDGWCYIAPDQLSDTSCDLVRTCPSSAQRRIRFPTANSAPRPGATAYLRCDVPPVAPPTSSRCFNSLP